MTPEMMQILSTDMAMAVRRQADDIQLAVARQRDGAAYDMRVLNGALSAAVLQTDDAQDFAHMNAGIRVPTTLDHPNVVTKP